MAFALLDARGSGPGGACIPCSRFMPEGEPWRSAFPRVNDGRRVNPSFVLLPTPLCGRRSFENEMMRRRDEILDSCPAFEALPAESRNGRIQRSTRTMLDPGRFMEVQ